MKGDDFQTGATVTFGAVPAMAVNRIDCYTLSVQTPAHAPGWVAVTVTNPDGKSAILGPMDMSMSMGGAGACPGDITPPTGCISGTVTKVVTGEPLAGKKVKLKGYLRKDPV